MREIVLVLSLALQPLIAAEGLADEAPTDRCEVGGLVAHSPAGWISVPMEDLAPDHTGCALMDLDGDEELLGLLRFRSMKLPDKESVEPGRLLAEEIASLISHGFALGDEPLWVRKDVPVRGEGFGQGRAVGLAATFQDSETPLEVHFLTFNGTDAEYVLALVTPDRATDEARWTANTEAMGAVMRTLQPADAVRRE